MIAGRPTNLWLGLATSVVGLAAVVALVAGVGAEIVAQLSSSVTAVLGALIALVAGQPPTLNPGDVYHITTPAGEPAIDAVAPAPPPVP